MTGWEMSTTMPRRQAFAEQNVIFVDEIDSMAATDRRMRTLRMIACFQATTLHEIHNHMKTTVMRAHSPISREVPCCSNCKSYIFQVSSLVRERVDFRLFTWAWRGCNCSRLPNLSSQKCCRTLAFTNSQCGHLKATHQTITLVLQICNA